MSENVDRVKGYLLDLDLKIVSENEAEELVVVDDEDNGIKQLVIDCEPPIIILEQLIGEVPAEPGDLFKRLLQMNNTLVHGAFVLDDETGGRIFFRYAAARQPRSQRARGLDPIPLVGACRVRR